MTIVHDERRDRDAELPEDILTRDFGDDPYSHPLHTKEKDFLALLAAVAEKHATIYLPEKQVAIYLVPAAEGVPARFQNRALALYLDENGDLRSQASYTRCVPFHGSKQ